MNETPIHEALMSARPQSSMSPQAGSLTPRTDVAERFMYTPGRPPVGFVMADFARRLENELRVAMEVIHGRATLEDLEKVQKQTKLAIAKSAPAAARTLKPAANAPSARPQPAPEAAKPSARPARKRSAAKAPVNRSFTKKVRFCSTRVTRPTTWPSFWKVKSRSSTPNPATASRC